MSADSCLAGRHIVVTRPVDQAANLCQSLLDAHAVPVRFPVLTISPVSDETPLLDMAVHLDSYDFVVFVSPNAVSHALRVMLRHRRWPSAVRAVSIGQSSELALAKFGVSQVLSPHDKFDSESLLALAELHQMAGKRVLVCRGDGGRELLGETLSARGATVDYLTCYHRAQATTDPAPLLKLWQNNTLDAVTLTSSEGVRYFAGMVGHLGLAYWRHTPTFVSHARIAHEAERHKLQHILLTEPGDAGLLAGLHAYFGRQ